MFVMAFMTLLCTGGAMFCVRFLVALCKEREPQLISTATEVEDRKRYFAKPGEAEWGC